MRLMLIAFALVAGFVLSGCSSSNDAGSGTDPLAAANSLDLHATDDTGVIRGIVVDGGIHPVGGVSVAIKGRDKSLNVTTAPDTGAFGAQGLPPGTYFLTTKKAGYKPGATSVEVVAGVSDPKATQIQIDIDVFSKPYYSQAVSKGFIECSFTLGAVSYAACSQPNGLPGCGTAVPCAVTQDQFLFRVTPDKIPTWMQSEMIWSNTQPAGTDMSLAYSYLCGNALYCDFRARGASPLLILGNATVMKVTNVGNSTDGAGNGPDQVMRVFSTFLDETKPPAPADNVCAPIPAVGTACYRGEGAVIEQTFTIYTHFFYGYTPGSWRFSSNTPVPSPPK